MTYVPVHCPDCQGVDVVQYGKQRHGPQRYRWNTAACPRRMFLLQSQHQGRLPAVQHRMVAMALHGSGSRETARVLGVSPTTGIDTLKKKHPHDSKAMKGCFGAWILSRVRASSTRWRTPRWRQGGALSAAKASSGGGGMRWIIAQDRSEPRALEREKITSSWNAKHS